jgi:hypothetical protein
VPVRGDHRLNHGRGSGHVGQPVRYLAHRRRSHQLLRGRRTHQVGQVRHGQVHVGGQPLHHRPPAVDHLLQPGLQFGQAGRRVHGRGGDGPHPVQPVGVEQPAQVRHQLFQVPGAEQVRLVERDQCDLTVAAEPGKVALVDDLVGVLLRVHHPHHQVDQSEQAGHLGGVLALDRVEVGQIQQHQPAHGRLAVHHLRLTEPVRRGDLEPLEQIGDLFRGAPHAGVRLAGGGTAYAHR